MSRIGAVILAAGESMRLGKPKQLIEIDGEPLLLRATRAAIDAGCRPVIVVLGAVIDPCREILRKHSVVTLENARWRDGMASSVVAGVSALDAVDVDAALLMVCDQPNVGADA